MEFFGLRVRGRFIADMFRIVVRVNIGSYFVKRTGVLRSETLFRIYFLCVLDFYDSGFVRGRVNYREISVGKFTTIG